jgi:potassium/hydrogen antiporter
MYSLVAPCTCGRTSIFHRVDIPGDLDREIACYRVMPGSIAVDRPVLDLHLPEETHITTVVRGDVVLTVNEALTLLSDDLVYIFTDPSHIPQLNRLFDPHRVPDRLEEDARHDETIAQYLVRRFHERPVVGDRAKLGKAELVVKNIENGRITKVGLRIRQN